MVRIISVASLGVHFSDLSDDQPVDGLAFEREPESSSSPPPPKSPQPKRMTAKVVAVRPQSNKTKK